MNGGSYYFDCGMGIAEGPFVFFETTPEDRREIMEAIKAGKSVFFSFSVRLSESSSIQYTPSMQVSWFSSSSSMTAFDSLAYGIGGMQFQFVINADRLAGYVAT